jgi:branched-chain amino acid transport system ATP-binding protein
VLDIKGISVCYDEIVVLRSISLRVGEREIISVVGANGAGKSTLLNAISGFLGVASGEIEFLGQKIHNLAPHQIVEKGIIQVPEGRELFASLSVKENLELGAYTRRAKQKKRSNLLKVFGIFPHLRGRQRQSGGTLSGGEQQMLAIARGLMSDPKVLMLDEPSLGLAPVMVDEVFRLIASIFEMGTPLLLVEQNVSRSLATSHRGYVLETGKIVLENRSERLLENDHLKKLYLGL